MKKTSICAKMITVGSLCYKKRHKKTDAIQKIGRRFVMEKKLSQEDLDLIDEIAKMTVDIAKLQAEIEIEKEKDNK